MTEQGGSPNSRLLDCLTPQVGEPVEQYVEPFNPHQEEQAHRRDLEALDVAHIAAAARAYKLLAAAQDSQL